MMRPVWVFDLDNTLHNAAPHIFPHINRSMTAYLQQHLGLDEQTAGELRRHYWQRYGATLSGMMKHHGTDPEHFLWHTHQFPELPQMAGFMRLLHKHRLNPAHCVMVEDSAENLLAAKRLGMRTVWVDATPRSPTYVDVKIRSVMELPRALSRLI